MPAWLCFYAVAKPGGGGGGGGSSRFVVKIENSPPQTSEFAKLDEKSVSFLVKTFFFFFFWRTPHFGRKMLWIWDFGRKITLNFGEDLFFFGEHLILGEKKLWISNFGREIALNFGEDLFFFFLENTLFWVEKTFELPSFPRNFVSIFGQTVWNWFRSNENSSQGRLHTSHSFKIAPPPFPNPGYAPAPTYLKNLINSRSVSERYSLRVNDDNWLLQTITSLNFAKSQSMFSYASPKVWNSLPLSLREIETLSLFKKRLKAFYCNLAFEDITTVWCQYFAAYCCRIGTSVEY